MGDHRPSGTMPEEARRPIEDQLLMIVCHCTGVRDKDVEQAARMGAETVEQAASFCGAGGRCGGCSETVREILGRARQERAAMHLAEIASAR